MSDLGIWDWISPVGFVL